MHSFATAAASREHLDQIDWSGVPIADRRVFEQSTLPRLLPSGAPSTATPTPLRSPHRPLRRPGPRRRAPAPARERHPHLARRPGSTPPHDRQRRQPRRHPRSPDPRRAPRAVDRGAQLSVEAVERRPGDAGGCLAHVDGAPGSSKPSACRAASTSPTTRSSTPTPSGSPSQPCAPRTRSPGSPYASSSAATTARGWRSSSSRP